MSTADFFLTRCLRRGSMGGVKGGKKFFKDIFSGSDDEDSVGGSEEGRNSDGGLDLFNQIKTVFKETIGAGSSAAGGAHKTGDDEPLSILKFLLKSLSSSDEAVKDLIDRARNFADEGHANETRTLREVFDLFSDSLAAVSDAIGRHFGQIDLGKLDIPSFFYFMEYDDEQKNPAWKRRVHRFFKSVKPEDVFELHNALILAELSYADTADQVRKHLNSDGGKDGGYELVYANMDCAPGEPAHFIAVKRQQSRFSTVLEVLLSVRGTKELGDLLSDALLDAVDYRGGKAHAGVIASGKYLVRKHTELLRSMLEMSGKKKVKLLLVGHSLGAGAAAIAALEFDDLDFVDATAVGFGCPALLSKDLSKSAADKILTVVADADVIPRMSGATIQNFLLDIIGFDSAEKVLRDVGQLIDVIMAKIPLEILRKDEGKRKKILHLVNSTLQKTVRQNLEEVPRERLEPVLVPPGRCIHFYR